MLFRSPQVCDLIGDASPGRRMRHAWPHCSHSRPTWAQWTSETRTRPSPSLNSVSVFVDTNVLLRAADPGDAKHETATKTISELLEAGETLCITPQIAAEFWNVATRP